MHVGETMGLFHINGTDWQPLSSMFQPKGVLIASVKGPDSYVFSYRPQTMSHQMSILCGTFTCVYINYTDAQAKKGQVQSNLRKFQAGRGEGVGVEG